MTGRVLVVALLAAAVFALAAPGFAAAACQQWTGAPPPSPGTQSNELSDVAVLGPCNAYAVGNFNSGSGDTALLERYSGSGWRRVTIPTPGTVSRLPSDLRSECGGWSGSIGSLAVGALRADSRVASVPTRLSARAIS